MGEDAFGLKAALLRHRLLPNLGKGSAHLNGCRPSLLAKRLTLPRPGDLLAEPVFVGATGRDELVLVTAVRVHEVDGPDAAAVG